MRTVEMTESKTSNWIQKNFHRLSSKASAVSSPASKPKETGNSDMTQKINEMITLTDRAMRSTGERLSSALRQKDEALSPRELRKTLKYLREIIEPTISEVEGGRRAAGVLGWYRKASLEHRYDCWLLMSEQFMADPVRAKTAQAKYAAAVGTPEEAVAEVRLRQSTVSPRRRLLQRFSVLPEGIRFLVDMRSEMLPHLKTDKRLQALDAEMEYMFSTWFDVGFLELCRLSWDSPASLIEKLILYEAVHDIKSWSDLKNRLDSDRRCYGFFHPRLPNEPLIFVEVALLSDIATSISPILDEAAEAIEVSKATTAIFYSISNTQLGLKGVSFGDSLIKRVVETLKKEFPKLKTFATLSPIPGLRHWLQKQDAALVAALQEVDIQQLEESHELRKQLSHYAARYLGQEMKDEEPLDPVARFHLGNGACVEAINWAADLSPKGMKQSFGLMVNYLYDLKKLDKHRDMLSKAIIPVSSKVSKLL
jgi:malonyl-CoA decarboxylase